MTLANPLALLWGLLAVAIVILYLRRIGWRREPVATGVIWQEVFAEEQLRSAWQHRRKWVSLAVQLTVLVLLVVALAEPQIPGPRRLVLIIDNSASMATRDVQPTRLAVAQGVAEQIVAGRRPCDLTAVLSAGAVVGVRSGWTGRQSLLSEAIRSIPEPRGITRMGAALGLARRMLGEQSPGEIVVLTDCCFDGAADLAAADDVKIVRVGKRTGNVALTRLAARWDTDASTCHVLAEVQNFSDLPEDCSFELRGLIGEEVQSMPIHLAAGGRWQESFETAGPEGGRVVALLDRDGPSGQGSSLSIEIPSTGGGRTNVVTPTDSATDVDLPLAAPSGRNESDLRVPQDIGIDAAEFAAARSGPSPGLYLAGLSVLLLTMQWALYQRRWLS